MRVLHLIKTAEGATWALRQIRELISLGYEVHVAIPPGSLISTYRELGVQLHEMQPSLPLANPSKWPELFVDVRDLVREVAPDLIHSHFVGTALTMRLALGRDHPTPRVFQVPGPLHLEHHFYRTAEIRLGGKADYWIGSCEWTCRRYLQSGIPPRRLALAYYGADLDAFTPQSTGMLRKELDLDGSLPIVGMVAYMYPPKRYLGQTRGLKGHEDLIDAVALARLSLPDIQLVVVGGAWNGAENYESSVREYGKKRLGSSVHFLGSRTDVAALYADFNVVAHPSHSENVGGAAESLLLGVPTVASNVGGLPDLIRPGQTGWLVPSKNSQQLAHALLDALANRERAMEYATRGRALAVEIMDVRRTARDVATIYESILDDPAD